MGAGAGMGDNRFSYTWKLQHRIGSSLQKNSLEHMFNETSFLSCSRKALGTLALLGVIGRLPFSALRGDRTWLDLSTRDGAPALSLSRHRL